MKMVRPYGQSVVEENDNSTHYVRKILPKKQHRHGEQPKTDNISSFFGSKYEFQLSLWISQIDKIYRKPKNEDVKKSNGKNFEKLELADFFKKRQKLGEACWTIFCEHFKLQNNDKLKELKERWDAKIHPYIKSYKECGEYYYNNKKFHCFTGNYYGHLTNDGSLSEQDIAKKIEQHIYEKAITKKHERHPKLKGLLAQRTEAIEKSVIPQEKDQRKNPILSFSENAWDEYWNGIKDDVIADIYYDLINPKIKKKPIHIIMEKLHAHWQEIFPHLKTIQEVKDTEKFKIHSAIKEYYKNLFKKKRDISTLKHSLPKNRETMKKKLIHLKNNKDTNYYIRRGKILHYQYGCDWNIEDIDITKSKYYTEKGQHEIKQNEAFVKIWLTVIASSIRTLQYWIDPNGHINSDIVLAEKTIKQNVLDDKSQKRTELLFGQCRDKFLFSEEKKQKELYIMINEYIAQIRHASFHFKEFNTFVDSFKNSFEQEDTTQQGSHNFSPFPNIQKNISYLYEADQKGYIDTLKSTLKSIDAQYYLEKEQAETILNSVISEQSDNLLPLPKLSRLLQRVQDIKTKGKPELPKAPHLKELEKNKALRLQYVVLKMVYDKSFRAWLNADNIQWHAIAKQVIKNITAQAKLMNGKTTPEIMLAAKADKIDYEYCKTISDLFYKLSAETAREFAVQAGYESDSEKAKEQAEYIENFKCDIVAQLLEIYLKEKQLSFINEIHKYIKKDRPIFQIKDLDDLPPMKISSESWEANLYFILHLVPVEEVNLLMHQIRKWVVVTEKTNRKEEERQLAGKFIHIMSLYNDMHDAKFINNSDIDYQSEFKEYYEGNLFDGVFLKSKDKTNKNSLIPIRGLREMLRYGDMKKLHPIFKKHHFTQTNFKNWQEFKEEIVGDKDKKTKIEDYQERKEKLHEKYEQPKKHGYLTLKEKQDYQILIKNISDYSHLQKQAYLINHKNLHRLMIGVLGRLVGYTHHYERDWYFITLAKIYEMGKKPEDVLECRMKELKNGQINAVFEQDKINKKDPSKNNLEPKNTEYNTLKSDMDNIISFTKNKSIRNDLAHFNMLNKVNTSLFPLTDWINKTRTLMSYDRKLKNSVATAMIELLRKENLAVTFQMNNDSNNLSHDLELKDIIPRTLPHLGGKGIKEDLHSQNYIDMVEALFGVSKPS